VCEGAGVEVADGLTTVPYESLLALGGITACATREEEQGAVWNG
jgi:hypothetical protein